MPPCGRRQLTEPGPAHSRRCSAVRRVAWVGLVVWLGLVGCNERSRASSSPLPIVTPGPVSAEAQANAVAVAGAIVPPRDVVALARQFGRLEPSASEAPTPLPADVNRALFWTTNHDTGASERVEAERLYRGDGLSLWMRSGREPDDRLTQTAASVIEGAILPRLQSLLGVDAAVATEGYGGIHILHTDNLGRGIVGYFSAADAYGPAVNPFSNELLMLYVNLRNAPLGSDDYFEVVAHELTHLLHWTLDPNEAAWTEEGLAELAAQLNGYNRRAEENVRAYMRQPDISLTHFSQAEQRFTAHYGASYLFMAYMRDRFGDAVIRRMAGRPEAGADGVAAALPTGVTVPFTTLFGEWLVANAAGGRDGAGPPYAYRAIDVPPLEAVAVLDRSGQTLAEAVTPFGVDYVRLELKEPATLVFTGTAEVPLLPAVAHSGAAFWSTLPADGADMSLTRSFDLSGLERATLRLWTWYDLESGWDYAYITASADGGATWQPLETIYTTRADPHGNSYGPGLTGISGPGDEPAWVEQTVDLTPFAGGSVHVQLRQINDQAHHEAGFAVDDIALPELGFVDDVEAGPGEWQAAGFVRHTNTVPQQWLLRLALLNRSPVEVQAWRPDADGRGRWVVTPRPEGETAILVVSGVTPGTLMPAAYRVALAPVEAP